MPRALIFAVPSGNPLAQRRKRKRDIAEVDEAVPADDAYINGLPKSLKLVSGVSAFPYLSADRAREYRTAGFDPAQEVPAFPFPHKPLFMKEGHQNSEKGVTGSSTALNPRLLRYGFSPRNSQMESISKSLSESQSHLAVLTAITHHSILDGDYGRAGKAWHQLLGSGPEGEELKQTNMDLRHHGRWALGAEILLRRGTQRFQQPVLSPLVRTAQKHIPATDEQPLNVSNLRAAREYYDRLAIQYPHHYNRVEKPTDFHLAMLTLWIYEATERSRSERRRIQQERSDALVNASPRSDVHKSVIPSSPSADAPGSQNSLHHIRTAFEQRVDRVRQAELRTALEIAARLDDIRTSLPLDKSIELMRLRAMVSLWLGDLFVPEPGSAGRDDAEQKQRDQDRDREVRRARDLLAEVSRQGGTISQEFLY